MFQTCHSPVVLKNMFLLVVLKMPLYTTAGRGHRRLSHFVSTRTVVLKVATAREIAIGL